MDCSEIFALIESASRVQAIHDFGNKWKAIKELYKNQLPAIKSRKGNAYTVDPYILDWVSIFTPIEAYAWGTIRDLGLPLYPQFPVEGVFVDFGDPVKRIAVECDGKDYHNEERDFIRDQMLSDAGWTVFRVSGSECRRLGATLSELQQSRECQEISDAKLEACVKAWATKTSDGLLNAIGWRFYGLKASDLAIPYYQQSLSAHSAFYKV